MVNILLYFWQKSFKTLEHFSFNSWNIFTFQALIHFVYTGVVVSGEDHFYSIMKLVYALNINASIEAESTNDRATTFNAPLVPPHLLGAVLKLPHMTAAAAAPLAHQQQSQLNNRSGH